MLKPEAKKMFDGLANVGVSHVRAWRIARRYDHYLICQDALTLPYDQLQQAVLAMAELRDDVVDAGLRAVLPF